MSNIKLLGHVSTATTTSDPIMIVNFKNEKAYKTTHGFVNYGEYVVDEINYYLDMINDTEEEYGYDNKQNCFLDKDGNPVSVGFSSSLFVPQTGINIKDIICTINSGELSEDLQSKIRKNALTLPFGVGIYKNAPVLYYKGVESDLLLYDLMVAIQNKVVIRLCKNCGRAFISSNNKQYCPESICQQAIIKNKWQNTKYSATGNYKRVRQRIEQKINGVSNKSPEWYSKLYENLADLLSAQRAKFPQKPNKNRKFSLWVGEWTTILNQINIASKFFCKQSDSPLLEAWSKECINLPQDVKKLRKWADSWVDKLNTE